MYNTTAALLHGEQIVLHEDRSSRERRGEQIADAFGRGRVVYLANHGLVVAGRTLEEAVVTAMVVEDQAQIHLAAHPRGAAPMDEALLASTKANHERVYVHATWAAGLRRLRVTDPDLAALVEW
jgi:ribulose-5-phosphate 4-epimerase/fuculose-1-phosphate aldolase